MATRVRRLILISTATTAMVAMAALIPWRGGDADQAFAAALKEPNAGPEEPDAQRAFRADALARADVWWPPASSPARLDRNPPDPGGALSGDIVRCRFLPHEADGTTPKFRCVLPDGEIVKVKYGPTGEIPAELAATRLLEALGFGADRMYLVPRLRCYGCPLSPFHALWVLDRLRARDFVTSMLPSSRHTDFEWVAVERRFDGFEVVDGDQEGWAWFELDRIDHGRGATAAEVDALRLAAAFLAHWDNKAANQRLVCRGNREIDRVRCESPAAFIQDLGATFGPNKVKLDGWEAAAVWSNPAECRVSMKHMPFHGSTFPDAVVSEAGRQLLARQLRALPESQVTALFAHTRFPQFAASERDADPAAWASVFFTKVKAIEEAGPCPR